eukprot:3934825-Amphidinium_carterae.1
MRRFACFGRREVRVLGQATGRRVDAGLDRHLEIYVASTSVSPFWAVVSLSRGSLHIQLDEA